jgi:large subunit ribosomal protein L4
VKRLARISALTYKAKDEGIMVVEDFKLETPKTKGYLQILDKLSLNKMRTLLVINESDGNIYLSARNLPQAKVLRAETLNTYEILHAKKLLIQESSLKTIEALLSTK